MGIREEEIPTAGTHTHTSVTTVACASNGSLRDIGISILLFRIAKKTKTKKQEEEFKLQVCEKFTFHRIALIKRFAKLYFN